jgi:hypothetical protein
MTKPILIASRPNQNKTLLNRATTRKTIRINRRFRRSLDYAPASGRPMRLGLPAGHKAGETDLAQLFVQVGRGVRIRLPPAARWYGAGGEEMAPSSL